jgi:undecaprenyl-diphosphatase
MITAREPKRAARIAVWTAAALLAALIGFSRVYLGVHYASDVIAGYAAAIVWVFTVGTVYRMRLRRDRRRAGSSANPLPSGDRTEAEGRNGL